MENTIRMNSLRGEIKVGLKTTQMELYFFQEIGILILLLGSNNDLVYILHVILNRYFNFIVRFQ
jgi:hypothetical protein